MKCTVHLDDFWDEGEEGNLSTQLKKSVSWDVVNQIKKSIADRVDKQIRVKIEAFIDDVLGKVIDKKINLEYIFTHKNKLGCGLFLLVKIHQGFINE